MKNSQGILLPLYYKALSGPGRIPDKAGCTLITDNCNRCNYRVFIDVFLTANGENNTLLAIYRMALPLLLAISASAAPGIQQEVGDIAAFLHTPTGKQPQTCCRCYRPPVTIRRALRHLTKVCPVVLPCGRQCTQLSASSWPLRKA